MRKFNAIKNAVNFGKGKKMNIRVGDKVKWAHVFRSINQNCFGHVVNTHVKVMGNPCFQSSSVDQIGKLWFPKIK